VSVFILCLAKRMSFSELHNGVHEGLSDQIGGWSHHLLPDGGPRTEHHSFNGLTSSVSPSLCHRLARPQACF
jgi:hypothetical protein